jgi:hypothetical protein
MSNRLFGSFSYKRTSKFTGTVLSAKYTARHSMLNTRLGAMPDNDVKTPHPEAKLEQPAHPMSVRRSVQRGKIV